MSDVHVQSYWSFLTGHDVHSGTYDDRLGQTYGYNSEVNNAARIHIGDVAVLRNKSGLLGTAVIEGIDERPGPIVRMRCPEPACRKAAVYERRTITPRFRCRECGHTFEAPITETIDGTWYSARYGASWEQFIISPRLAELHAAFAGSPSTNAIDRLDPLRAREFLERNCSMTQLTLLFGAIEGVEGSDLHISGGRRTATVKVRRGQPVFREALIKRFGEACAITGPCPRAALEAAHLVPFSQTESHDVRQGRLLRSDLHRLLDAGLLTIDVSTWTVVLAPSLRSHPAVRELHGCALTLHPKLRPDPEPLREHLRVCEERW